MAPDKPVPSETQEQSIKSRKHQMYDAEPAPVASGSLRKVKSTQDYLRETPAAPLSKVIKATLWGTAGIVLLLFIVVLTTLDRRQTPGLTRPSGPKRLIAASTEPSAPQQPTEPGPWPTETTQTALAGAPSSQPEPRGKTSNGSGSRSSTPKPAPELSDSPVPQQVEWRVVADPPEQPFEISEGQDVSLPIPSSADRSGKVLFPSTPSPYVAVGDNQADAEAREVWDLRTKRRAGILRGTLQAQPPFTLTPDGMYFAAKSFRADKDKKKENTVAVWSFKTGHEVKHIKLKSADTDYLEFAGPDLLVTSTVSSRVFQLWDFQKGEKVGEFQVPGPVDRESLAVSPGRRYLAMTSAHDGLMRVYDLTDRKPAGELPLPKQAGPNWNCVGMTFSNDGKELAAAFASAGKTRILCWDLAAGKLGSDLGLDDTHAIDWVQGDQGRSLEWLPEGDGWLVYGQVMVDQETGRRYWTLALYAPDFPPAPRRMLNGDRALIVWGQGRSQVVRSVALPKDKVASAKQFERAGGSAVDAVLPALKTADLTSPRSVPDSAGSWSVTPDPAPAPHKLINRPIALKNKLSEVQQVVCSGPEAGQAVVAIRTTDRNNLSGNALAAGQTHSLERYDLASGKRVGQNEIPTVCELVAFSPDGARVLLRDADQRERLDVYAAADLKHLAGWRPYQNEAPESRTVVWTTFLDQHRVVTVNPAGKLVLWAVPDCRAMYVVKDAFQGVPLLSPGRKYLAGFAGGSIRFLDSASGKRLGEVTTPSAEDGGNPGLMAAAFRLADGLQLAVLLNGNLLVRIDVVSGKVVSEFRSPVAQGPLLEWCGTRHVLINNQSLVDLDRQWEVWRYVGGVPALGSPDGRHWAAVEPFSNSPAYLGGFVLPDKGLDKLVALVADKKAPALLRAGTSLSLRIDASGPPRDAEGFRKTIFEHFAGQLRANDIKVEVGQPVTLVVKADEVDTGEKVESRMLFPSLGDSDTGKKPISNRYLEFDVEFTDSTGKVTYEPRQTVGLRELGALKLPKGEKDPDKFLRTQLWEVAKGRLTAVTLPPFLARQPEGLVRFPGSSNLARLAK